MKQTKNLCLSSGFQDAAVPALTGFRFSFRNSEGCLGSQIISLLSKTRVENHNERSRSLRSFAMFSFLLLLLLLFDNLKPLLLGRSEAI